MKKNNKETSLILPVTPQFIERRIHIIRGVKVILDSDLAELYQVLTKNLNKAVKRNTERFPSDFMFQLTLEEVETMRFQIGTASHGNMRSQNATASGNHRNTRYRPYAFTELGVAMLSSVLNSDRAVQMNIYIMRAFVKLREIMATNKEVAEKIEKLEEGQKENREDILAVASTLKRLMDEPIKPKGKMGFDVEN
jgi:hypothetical protein